MTDAELLEKVGEMLDKNSSLEIGEGLSMAQHRASQWFLYVGPLEIHCRLNPRGGAKPFPSALAALRWLYSDEGQAVVKKARKGHAAD